MGADSAREMRGRPQQRRGRSEDSRPRQDGVSSSAGGKRRVGAGEEGAGRQRTGNLRSDALGGASRSGQSGRSPSGRATRSAAGSAQRQVGRSSWQTAVQSSRSKRPSAPRSGSSASAAGAQRRSRGTGRAGACLPEGTRNTRRLTPKGRGARSGPPAGPRYGLRRAVALAVVLALVTAFCVGVVTTAIWVRDTVRSQDVEAAREATHVVYNNPAPCRPQDIEALVSAPDSTVVGAGVSATMLLRNTSGEACLLDVGGQNVGFVLSSGPATSLDTAQCTVSPAEHLLLVAAGDEATVQVRWDGTIAAASCLPGSSSGDGDPEAQGQGSTSTTAEGAAGTAASPAPEQATPDGAASATQTEGKSHNAESGAHGTSGDGAAENGTSPQSSAHPTTEATAAVDGDAHETTDDDNSDRIVRQTNVVTVSGGGDVAASGTYLLRFQVGGREVSSLLLLIN